MLAGVSTAVIPENTNSAFWLVRRCVEQIRAMGIQLVHTHRAKENLVGSIAAAIAGIPSIRTAHGLPERPASMYTFRQNVIAEIDNFVARRLQSAVVAVSGELANRLEARLPRQKVYCIPNGLGVSNTQPVPRADRRSSTIALGCVGRLVPVKRFDVAIETVAQLPEIDGRPVTLSIFGDGPLRPNLLALSEKLGVGSRVHLRGFVTETAKIFSEIDVLLVPSDHEGLPMVILEAMHAGVPIVAHQVGGLVEVLEDGPSGLLLKTQNARDWAESLRELFTHPGFQATLQENARHRLNERYVVDVSAESYERLYEEVVHKSANSTLRTV